MGGPPSINKRVAQEPASPEETEGFMLFVLWFVRTYEGVWTWAILTR